MEVSILSGSHIFSRAMQHWLESGPDRFPCRILDAERLHSASIPSDEAVVMVICRHWSEMARWASSLKRRFSAPPWLLVADLRLAGMFAPLLEDRLCTLISPDWPPEELPLALKVLARRRALYAPADLWEQFCRAAPCLPDGRSAELTPRELQCGCAVSLALTNAQIADTLCLAEATVKNRVSNLMTKLQAGDREALAAYFERGLALLSSTPGRHSTIDWGSAPHAARFRNRSIPAA